MNSCALATFPLQTGLVYKFIIYFFFYLRLNLLLQYPTLIALRCPVPQDDGHPHDVTDTVQISEDIRALRSPVTSPGFTHSRLYFPFWNLRTYFLGAMRSS